MGLLRKLLAHAGGHDTYFIDGLLKLFRCYSKFIRPVAQLVLLVNIDPFPVPVVAFIFMVRHDNCSRIEKRTDLPWA